MLMYLAYSLRYPFCPFCPSVLDLALFSMILTLPPQLCFFSTETVLAEILMPACLCKLHIKTMEHRHCKGCFSEQAFIKES